MQNGALYDGGSSSDLSAATATTAVPATAAVRPAISTLPAPVASSPGNAIPAPAAAAASRSTNGTSTVDGNRRTTSLCATVSCLKAPEGLAREEC